MATWSPIRPAGSGACSSVSSVQSTTEAGPPANLTDGISLDDLQSILPIFSAPNAQTFTGSGSAQAWFLPDQTIYPGSAWVRMPSADVDLADGNGLASFAAPGIPIYHAAGRLALLYSAAGWSGGGQGGIAIVGSSRQTGKAK